MSGRTVAPVAVPRAVDILDRRPDLIGVHATTDVLDQTGRWSA